MASPLGTATHNRQQHHHQESNQASSSFNAPDSWGLSLDWTPEEQAILEEGLSKYGSESNLLCYAKIAFHLPNKTVRDVALRCRWMTRKDYSKRRKEDNFARKSKEKKERFSDPLAKTFQFLSWPNAYPYANPLMGINCDSGISYKANGGVTVELLEQNALAFNQISANLSTFQIHENIDLLCRTRDNILKIMNNLNGMPPTRKQMPPLPVRLNEELANTILPRPNMVVQHYYAAA